MQLAISTRCCRPSLLAWRPLPLAWRPSLLELESTRLLESVGLQVLLSAFGLRPEGLCLALCSLQVHLQSFNFTSKRPRLKLAHDMPSHRVRFIPVNYSNLSRFGILPSLVGWRPSLWEGQPFTTKQVEGTKTLCTRRAQRLQVFSSCHAHREVSLEGLRLKRPAGKQTQIVGFAPAKWKVGSWNKLELSFSTF